MASHPSGSANGNAAAAATFPKDTRDVKTILATCPDGYRFHVVYATTSKPQTGVSVVVDKARARVEVFTIQGTSHSYDTKSFPPNDWKVTATFEPANFDDKSIRDEVASLKQDLKKQTKLAFYCGGDGKKLTRMVAHRDLRSFWTLVGVPGTDTTERLHVLDTFLNDSWSKIRFPERYASVTSTAEQVSLYNQSALLMQSGGDNLSYQPRVIYDHVCNVWVQKLFDGIVKDVNRIDNSELLTRTIVDTRRHYKILLRLSACIFMQVNQVLEGGSRRTERSYGIPAPAAHGTGTIPEGLESAFFKLLVMPLLDRLVDYCKTVLHRYRDGEDISVDTLSGACAQVTQSYEQHASGQVDGRVLRRTKYVEPLLHDTETYYRNAGDAKWSENGGHYTYSAWVLRVLEREEEISKTMQLEFRPQVLSRIVTSLLSEQRLKDMVQHDNSGLKVIIDDYLSDGERVHVESFRRLVSVATLVTKTPPANVPQALPLRVSLTFIADEYAVHIRRTVEDFLKQSEEQVHRDVEPSRAIIDGLISYSQKYFVLVNVPFTVVVPTTDSGLARDCLHKAFKTGLSQALDRNDGTVALQREMPDKRVQKSTSTLASLMATYLHALVQGSLKLEPEEEQKRLELCGQLFDCVRTKDVFQERYQHLLAQRLLSGKHDEAREKSVLVELQKANGRSFVHRFEMMLNDFEATKQMQEQFEAFRSSTTAGSDGDTNRQIPFTANVLTAAHWPSYKATKLQLPPVFKSSAESFMLFYVSRHSLKKLSWQHVLGNAVVRLQYAKDFRELSCSLLQACAYITVAAAGRAGIVVSDLATTLDVSEADVQAAIAPSVFRQPMFFTCIDAAGGTVPPKDRDGFRTNRIRLADTPPGAQKKIDVRRGESAMKDVEPSAEALDSRRKLIIDAAAVRVMKSRRTLPFTELCGAVVEQVKLFAAQPPQIKNRIDDLITRGYLERDPENRNILRYLA